MEIYGANPVDIVVLVVLLVSGLLALLRGFVAEVLSIAGFIAAIFAALYGIPYVLPAAEQYLDKGVAAQAASVGVLFFGTLLICSILTYLISRRVRKTNLSMVDRSLGFLFGLLRGGLLVCLLYICVTFVFPPPKGDEEPEPNTMQAVLANARTAPALQVGADMIASFAPDKGLTLDDLTKVDPLRDLVQPQLEKAQTAVKEQIGEKGYTMPSREDINRLIDSNEDKAQ